MNDRFGLPKPKSITPRFTEAELAQGARAGPAADQGPRGRGEGAPLSAGSNSERDTSRSPPNRDAVGRLADLVSAGNVTLLFGAHDAEHNNAVALVDYLAAH
jgi:hypothetical protein